MIVFEWLIKATIFDILGKIHVLKLENIGLVAKKERKDLFWSQSYKKLI
jgi:hypothetical protein